MRRHGKVDNNQRLIVEALRVAGCSVQSLSSVGSGCPDLLVGHNGVNLVLEVKDGSLPPSARQLTSAQIVWHRSWRGSVHVVHSVNEALTVACVALPSDVE